jgi:imidazoleglycerol-phosphate dehydratase
MNRTAVINESIHGFPIDIKLNIDGQGKNSVETGVGMFDHLLQLFSKHGNFDLDIKCKADLQVDDHHLVDEVAMNLGLAFKNALSKQDKSKINRYGFFILPMDEALITCATDFCGRSSFVFDVKFSKERIGELGTDMIREFWSLFSQKAEINFVIKSEYGINDHHIAEALFKCAAKTIKVALTIK